MSIITYAILLLLIVLGITFAALNSQTVMIHYYVGQCEMPLSLLLVCMFAAGCIFTMIISLWMAFKMRMKNFKLRQQLKTAEKHIEQLRAQ